MSDRLTRTELLKLSLDEYIERYVVLPMGKRSMAQHHSRTHHYQRTHYFGPSYVLQQRERFQRRRQEREERLQRKADEMRSQERMQELRLRLQMKYYAPHYAGQMRQLHKRWLHKFEQRMQWLRQDHEEQLMDKVRLENDVEAIKKENIDFKWEIIDPKQEILGEEANNLLKPIDEHNYNPLVSMGFSMVTDSSHCFKQQIKQSTEDFLICKVETVENQESDDAISINMQIETETTETINNKVQNLKKEFIEMEEDINSDMLYIPTNFCIYE